MPWGFAAAAIGTVAGAVISSNAAGDAANTEAQAANNATNTQLQMFDQTQANEAPYLQAGNNALVALQQGVGVGPGTNGTGVGSLNAPFTTAQFQNSPGYQFQMQQGENAVLNNRSALGGVDSGNTLKALTQFGQGTANQDYWNAYNAYTANQNQRFGQLQTLAGSGQNAAGNLGALGTQVGASVGNNIIGAGNASAAGTVATGNTISNGINNLSSNYLLFNALQGGSPFGGTPSYTGNGNGEF